MGLVVKPWVNSLRRWDLGVTSRGTNAFASSALDGWVKVDNSIGGCKGGGWGRALSVFLMVVWNADVGPCVKEVAEISDVDRSCNV